MKTKISLVLFFILSQANLYAIQNPQEVATSFIGAIRSNDYSAYYEAFLPELSHSASPLALGFRRYEINELDKLGFTGNLLVEASELNDENARLFCSELMNVFLLNSKDEPFQGGIVLCLHKAHWKVVYAEFSGNSARP